MSGPLMREVMGETLRDIRTASGKTLRDVSGAARISLGYLSEVERGQKEASSELLAAICSALEVSLSDVLQVSSVRARGREVVTPFPVRTQHRAVA